MNSRFDPDQAAYYQASGGRPILTEKVSRIFSFMTLRRQGSIRGKIGLCNLLDSAQISTWKQLVSL